MENTDIDDIKLNCQWDVWYHHSLNNWLIGGYRKIFEIKTMRDFWEFHNNIDCLGGINNLHFFIMRAGITPIYEDIKNRAGGTWSMLAPMQKAYASWEHVAVKLIGETLSTNPLSITGISINVKSDVSVIKIWNNNKGSNSASQLAKIPNLQSEIIYRQHKLVN
jgi:hypothetical protein